MLRIPPNSLPRFHLSPTLSVKERGQYRTQRVTPSPSTKRAGEEGKTLYTSPTLRAKQFLHLASCLSTVRRERIGLSFLWVTR